MGNQPLLIKKVVFFDEKDGRVVRGVIYDEDASNGKMLVHAEKHATKAWLDSDTLRFADEEARRRAATAYQEARAVELSLQANSFPDMRGFDVPAGPLVSRRLPRQMRELQKYGGYRPADLPPLFWDFLKSAFVPLPLMWPARVHADMLSLLQAVGVRVPNSVRPLNTGRVEPEAEEAGSVQGYVYLPIPPDMSIVPHDFLPRGPVIRGSKLRLGNCRLVVGLHLSDPERWPIHFLTEKTVDSQPEMCYA